MQFALRRGFPAGNLDSAAIADWGVYCQAAQLAMSVLLDTDLAAVEADALAMLVDSLPEGAENPYTLQADLQQIMNDLVGIIRRAGELQEALTKLAELKQRAKLVKAAGGRKYNPGWHLALDIRNMLAVSECIAKAALERAELRGGHTREDNPGMNPVWRKVNLICSLNDDGGIALRRQPLPTMTDELLTCSSATSWPST